jgi:hypothetical protein
VTWKIDVVGMVVIEEGRDVASLDYEIGFEVDVELLGIEQQLVVETYELLQKNEYPEEEY